MSTNSQRIYDVTVKRVDKRANKTVFLLPDGQEVLTDSSAPWVEGRRGVLTQTSTGQLQFCEYVEQRLRKVGELAPEQGIDGCAGHFIWQLDGQSNRIITKYDFIPGEDGEFIPDRSVELKLAIPVEFTDLCESRGMSPQDVLKGLIADICGLKNYFVLPREDGYCSNGSDERMYAEQWFERAYPDWGDSGVKS